MATKNLELYYMHRPIADITALKAIDTTSIVSGLTVLVEGKGLCRFDKLSTEPPDDKIIYEPTIGGGRWYLMT